MRGDSAGLTVRYGVAGNHIVHELIDDEVLVINFETGAYYSLGGSAVSVWAAFADDLTPAEAAAGLEDRYDVDSDAAAAAAVDVAGQLLDEGLIRRIDEGAAEAPSPRPLPPDGGEPFAAPVIEK